MAEKLQFTKMQGIGNDYVYVNGFEQQIDNPAVIARKISNRNFGIGSDGLVIVLPSAQADIRMRMFNPDGSEAEMCGNAARCVGKFAYDNGLARQPVIRLETAAGIKVIRLLFDGPEVTGAVVDMGEPILTPAQIPLAQTDAASRDKKLWVAEPLQVEGRNWPVTAVSMGNPHAVIFAENIASLDLGRLGPQFETHPLFPHKTNTEFVENISRTRLRMRVWERGTGETLACGTGACAAAVAGVLNGLTEREVDVELPGGTLHINWDAAGNHVFMSGPAETVFTGTYYY